MITITEIQGRIAQIKRLGKSDPEAAHSEEDRLLMDVLHCIAENERSSLGGLAREVIKVHDLEFPRWKG